jgi:hypothetical protein
MASLAAAALFGLGYWTALKDPVVVEPVRQTDALAKPEIPAGLNLRFEYDFDAMMQRLESDRQGRLSQP